MESLALVIKRCALDYSLKTVKTAPIEKKTTWTTDKTVKFYKTVNNIECVQPQDRLITLLMDLATSRLDVWDTIK